MWESLGQSSNFFIQNPARYVFFGKRRAFFLNDELASKLCQNDLHRILVWWYLFGRKLETCLRLDIFKDAFLIFFIFSLISIILIKHNPFVMFVAISVSRLLICWNLKLKIMLTIFPVWKYSKEVEIEVEVDFHFLYTKRYPI